MVGGKSHLTNIEPPIPGASLLWGPPLIYSGQKTQTCRDSGCHWVVPVRQVLWIGGDTGNVRHEVSWHVAPQTDGMLLD
jgi:hypothetical protein